MVKESDPRTNQFLHVLVAISVLSGAHVISFFLALQSGQLFSNGYQTLVFIALPAIALIIGTTFAASRRWHWGQAVLLVIAALVATLIQALIIGEASASV